VRFLGFAALIGLSLSILRVSTAASADQCPQKESPFRTDRPDVTNSSLVVPQGSFQSENGINFSQREGNHEFDGTNSRLRWGIAPCLEGQSAALGHSRRLSNVGMSASPLTPDVGLRRSEPTLRAQAV
jgi:hypothetical protein